MFAVQKQVGQMIKWNKKAICTIQCIQQSTATEVSGWGERGEDKVGEREGTRGKGDMKRGRDGER